MKINGGDLWRSFPDGAGFVTRPMPRPDAVFPLRDLVQRRSNPDEH